MLVTADGFCAAVSRSAMKPIADEAAAGAPSVQHVVVVSAASASTVPMATARHRWSAT